MSYHPLKSPSFWILVLLLSACADRPPEAGQTTTPPPPERSTMHAVLPFADLDSAAGAAIAAVMADDRGIVYPVSGAPPTGTPGGLVIRQDRNAGAQIVAYLDFHSGSDGGWTDTLRATVPDLYGQLARAGHEDYGLAADSVHDGWARVIYGYLLSGEEQRGWVRLKRDSVQLATYDSLMMQYSSWFANPAAVTFYQQPNGPTTTFSLDPSYAMSVQAVLGPWIRVQAHGTGYDGVQRRSGRVGRAARDTLGGAREQERPAADLVRGGGLLAAKVQKCGLFRTLSPLKFSPSQRYSAIRSRMIRSALPICASTVLMEMSSAVAISAYFKP